MYLLRLTPHAVRSSPVDRQRSFGGCLRGHLRRKTSRFGPQQGVGVRSTPREPQPDFHPKPWPRKSCRVQTYRGGKMRYHAGVQKCRSVKRRSHAGVQTCRSGRQMADAGVQTSRSGTRMADAGVRRRPTQV